MGKGLGVFIFDRELAAQSDPNKITIPIGSIYPDTEGPGKAPTVTGPGSSGIGV